VLTLKEWRQQPWYQSLLDNTCRLASAVV